MMNQVRFQRACMSPYVAALRDSSLTSALRFSARHIADRMAGSRLFTTSLHICADMHPHIQALALDTGLHGVPLPATRPRLR